MKKYLTKRNIYITLFTVLYLAVGIVSLIHSFAFFGLANSTVMSVMLGCCFEVGQVAVLMSLLTSKKEQSRVMPWVLMFICTAVQILGNIFSSYKYLMLHSVADLKYFTEPIFVWTDLPDNITTVIVTYIVGAILPIIALCMTSMVSNYIMEDDETPNKDVEELQTQDKIKDVIKEESKIQVEDKSEDTPKTSQDKVVEPQEKSELEQLPETEQENTSHFINL